MQRTVQVWSASKIFLGLQKLKEYWVLFKIKDSLVVYGSALYHSEGTTHYAKVNGMFMWQFVNLRSDQKYVLLP